MVHLIDRIDPISYYAFLIYVWVQLMKVDKTDINNANKKIKKHFPFSKGFSITKSGKVRSASYESITIFDHWQKMLEGLQMAVNHFKVYNNTRKRNNWPLIHEHNLQAIGLHISRYRAYSATMISDEEHKHLCKVFEPCYIITHDNLDGRGFYRCHDKIHLINSYIVGKANGKWNLFFTYNDFVTCNAFGGTHISKMLNDENDFNEHDYYDILTIGPRLAETFFEYKWPKVQLVENLPHEETET